MQYKMINCYMSFRLMQDCNYDIWGEDYRQGGKWQPEQRDLVSGKAEQLSREVAIFLLGRDAGLVMRLPDHAVVMHQRKKLPEGKPEPVHRRRRFAGRLLRTFAIPTGNASK